MISPSISSFSSLTAMAASFSRKERDDLGARGRLATTGLPMVNYATRATLIASGPF